MIMEVVAERLNVRYNLISSLASQVPWEEYWNRSVMTFDSPYRYIPKVT